MVLSPFHSCRHGSGKQALFCPEIATPQVAHLLCVTTGMYRARFLRYPLAFVFEPFGVPVLRKPDPQCGPLKKRRNTWNRVVYS